MIEDACQAVGATDGERPAGTMGRMGAFSFYPTKNLGGAGDAGAVTTNDAPTAQLLRGLRLHGETSRYHHSRVGGNFRMDAVQAAVLLAKLPRLEILERSAAGDRGALWRAPFGCRRAESHPAVEAPGKRHVYHQYVVRVPDRDAVRARLSERGIATAVFYPVPLHLQECFAGLGYREGAFPQAEKAASEVLALPIFAEMTDAEVERVAEELRKTLS